MQIINVYNQEYESGAAFWPDVHGRIIGALIISQLLLMGLLSTKQAAQSTPFLIALPILTISFHYYCKGRFEPAFTRFPLQVCFLHNLDFSAVLLFQVFMFLIHIELEEQFIYWNLWPSSVFYLIPFHLNFLF